MSLPSRKWALPALFAIGSIAFLVTCAKEKRSPRLTPKAHAQPKPAPSAAPAAAPSTSSSGMLPLSPGARIEDERNTIGIFRRVSRSTVFVTQKRLVVDRFDGSAREVAAGSGSGFVWDKQGRVVTNFHVIKGAQSLTVTLDDQRTYKAEVVGMEPRKDIAVLKIGAPASSLFPISVAKGRTPLEVGQKAVAIGNPFGLDHTLTTGVVSALGRGVKGIGGVTIRDMIQTDAAINPGNSGGPLLDSSGRLIGMNTMIFSRSGASAGIGFAVPISTIRRIVPQIIRNGKAEHVGMGIRVDPTARIARKLGIKGVVVLAVAPKGPAGKAGIKGLRQGRRGMEVGDVIVGLGPDSITNYDELYQALDKHKAGDRVQVRVLRDRKLMRVAVTLKKLDD